jgi:transposase
MARLQGVPEKGAGVLVRFAYWLARRWLGKVPEPLTVTAHHARIFQAYTVYEFALGRSRRVDERLKALAGLKAAALIGCPF